MKKQARRFLLTVNNPAEKQVTHDSIKSEMEKLTTVKYYCMSDEIGAEGTYHTHIFLACSSCLRFSTLKRHFPAAHIDSVNGTSEEARAYVLKTGKWEDDEKRGTQVPNTQFEWGEVPQDRQGERVDLAVLLGLIKDGMTNAEIIESNPDYLLRLNDIDRTRQTLVNEEYRERWRNLEVTYIWGATGTGKTRSVREGQGYANVYAVNNYKHPFDGYAGENVMLFDEFNSNFRIQDMNNYLDGYPLTLPARYSNKQACYERVIIISNLDLREQYAHEKRTQPDIWAAFVRRIHKVIRFMPDGTRREYDTGDYLSGADDWAELPDDTPTPFDKGVPLL